MPTPERTSVDAIVDAATQLLEEGGAAAITMQAVALSVGVKAPSLYKRVRDREALLGLVGESAARDLTARLEGEEGSLEGLLLAFRGFARQRPEAFRLLFTTVVDPEALAATSAPVLRATEAAVGPARALDAARLLTAWATGFATMELAGAFRLGGDLDEAYRYGVRHLVASLVADHEPERPAQGS